MLQKWKNILTNWINCYCNENENQTIEVNFEAILDIIEHLRKNLNQDESRSSLLNAHTIQEFILEKYPGFTFENGTPELTTEEDLFLSASLLLYFICVNSKNVNLKKAMCNNLGASDQEIILKFSKCLMGCSHISSSDVLAAITEACGQDVAGASETLVPETPPALRSLHSEVRRLQAALDAERFDRNFLQEELSRTNLKLENLSKIKEEYKLEIASLKTKISEYYGEEKEIQGQDKLYNNSVKLTKQLVQTEERLVSVQEELANIQYERDTYKNKLDDLKGDRDKYLALSQEENIRASQLAEELEVERRTCNTLRELVSELRQHNRLNGFDTSLLECDDPDTSLHSLQHNSSICTEACANVIEVQLGEERAKITTLRNQIQTLQDQLKEISSKYENEKQNYTKVLSEKDLDIRNLKQKVNEEVEMKNIMKSHYDDYITKLNNEVNELEQMLKETTESSRKTVDSKLQEIQTLQEEKLSILHSFSNETTKLENIIKDIKCEVEAERNSKLKIREDYDNHIMKLNEKVLNRNNELVELQNKIVEKGEKIEELQIQLRNEKDMRQELITKHNSDTLYYNKLIKELNYNVQKQSEDIQDLQKQVQQYYTCIEDMNKEKDGLHSSLKKLKDDYIKLHDDKELYSKEKEKLLFELDEKNETVTSLRMQLQTEIDFKNDVQNKLFQSEETNELLSKNVTKLSEDLTKIKLESSNLYKKIEALEWALKEQHEMTETLKLKNDDLTLNIEQLSETIERRNDEITSLEKEKQLLTQTQENKNIAMESQHQDLKNNFQKEITEHIKCKENLCEQIKNLESLIQKERDHSEKTIIEKDTIIQTLTQELNDNINKMEILETKMTELNNIISEKTLQIEHLVNKNKDLTEDINCKEETVKLLNNDKDTLKSNQEKLVDTYEKEKLDLENKIIDQQKCNYILQNEVKDLKNTIDTERRAAEIKMMEKINSYEEMLQEIDIIKKENENLTQNIQEYKEEIMAKSLLIKTLTTEKSELMEILQKDSEVIKSLEEQLKTIQENQEKMVIQYEMEKVNLNNKVALAAVTLEDHKNKYAEDMEEFKKSKIELQEQNVYLEDLINTERHKIKQETIEKVASLNFELDKIRKDKLVLEENISMLQKDIKEKTIRLEQYVTECSALRKKLEANKKALQILEREIGLLKANQKELKHNCELEKQELLYKLKTTESKLEQEINNTDYIKSSQMLQEQVKSLEALIETEKQTLAMEEEKKIALLKELNDRKEENKVLNENVKDLDKDLEDKTSQVGNLKVEIEDLSQQIESKTKALQDYEEHIKTTMSSCINMIIDDLKNEDIASIDVINNLEKAVDMDPFNSTHTIIETVKALSKKLALQKSLEKSLRQENKAIDQMSNMVKKTKTENNMLQTELQRLQNEHHTAKLEHLKRIEEYKKILEVKTNDLDSLQLKNATLHNELNNARVQLDTKIHSLKDKLIDNENLTDKLKMTYECQIDNLNIMVSKLTDYLKDRTMELDALRKEEEQLQTAVKESHREIEALEEEVKSQKQNQEKLISKFESERLVLRNMVDVTESQLKDQNLSLNNKIIEHIQANDDLKKQARHLEGLLEIERQNLEVKAQENMLACETVHKELNSVKHERDKLNQSVLMLQKDMDEKIEEINKLMSEKDEFAKLIEQSREEILSIEKQKEKIKEEKDDQFNREVTMLKNELDKQCETIKKLESLRKDALYEKEELMNQLKQKEEIVVEERNHRFSQMEEIHKLQELQAENIILNTAIKEKEIEISSLKKQIESENERNNEIYSNNRMEHRNLVNKCGILQEYQMKAEEELQARQKEIDQLQEDMNSLHKEYVHITQMNTKNVEIINKLTEELEETQKLLHKQEREKRDVEYGDYKGEQPFTRATKHSADKDQLSPVYCEQRETNVRELRNQVHDSAMDNTVTSTDSCKTITDLENIIQDKNRAITTLHSDVKYLKTLVAESENKLLDVTKDLDLSRENCHQLSSQLKKIVHQKNEEISELKKQVAKMSVTENRASQIIKVSAKYQAMILKRICEIKTNTVLKELTNLGNSTSNYDSELRRSLNVGAITMEDLENFLETTDRHLRRCSEKQVSLQKERDRLIEINKINDSEIISVRKFLTELSVSVKTFNSVKDLYTQKMSRVVSMQRTVRKEILDLDGHITDAAMCKLERAYAAIMQDLAECALNLERWIERSICRTISPEKIKQAFMSDLDRASLVSTNFQNTSLEIQLGELENSFQKLLEEVMRAQKGEGAKDAQSLTVMEVRAEYEDKLNRMKAKMKQLYCDQITIFKEQQRKEIEALERKLEMAQEKLQESSKAYEDHIRGLTTELWNVGEKFIIQKDETDWLRKKQKHGSLMSLQHVHSSGLVGVHEEAGRPSDTYSLRSLPANKGDKKERRGLHMSDEEGEVFDNRCLRELTTPPRGDGRGATGARLSELRWRNSLCPPHLKSSYPAETQFAPALQEEEIKCAGSMSLGGKQQRKEVGITAYKKPGPPTPSKQAGRLSATDSELRESLRVEAEPSARRTGTPSRLLSLFRSRHDTAEGTPRARRLSNIFRKK